ncbi:MAG: DNA polymerase III subunit gamma/tau, partial [Propionibacteriaceae bacterium]|nr:DNA polymerase III subunit gamma/tau [Propionibacteriaceae bacterium]
DSKGVFAAVDKVIEIGLDPHRFAEDLLTRLRDLIIVAAVPEAIHDHLVDVAQDQGERLTSQARSLGPGELTRAAEVIATGLTEMRGTTAPRLHLELMCARVLLPGADVNGRGIHARLDRLERRLSMAEMPVDESTVTLPKLTAPVRQAAPALPDQAANDLAVAPTPVEPIPSSPVKPSADDEVQAIAPVSQPVASQSTAGMGTADLRSLWPKILDEVKGTRRFTWILLSQNAQVIEVKDGALTLGMANAGARESFARGGSVDILKQAIITTIGADLHIETVLMPAAEAEKKANVPPQAPAPAPEPPPAAAEARRKIQPTRMPGSTVEAEPTAEPSRDDETLPDTEDIAELLRSQLGATLIEAADEGEPL